jgi:hypothetical protein
MLDNPVARQQFARELAKSSMGGGDEDGPAADMLSAFDRSIVGGNSVIIKLPLRDPVEVRRYLGLIEETCRELRLRMEQRSTDRSHLFMVRGVLRVLHKKLNAYKTPRRE